MVKDKILNDLGFDLYEEKGIDLNIEFIPAFGLSEERQIDRYLEKVDETLVRFPQNEYERLHKEMVRLIFMDAFLESYRFDKESTIFNAVSKETLMEYLVREYPGYIRSLAIKINNLLTDEYLDSLSFKNAIKPNYKSIVFKDAFYNSDIIESINMINSFDLDAYYKTKDKEGRTWLRDKSDIANLVITPMQTIGISGKGSSIHADLMLRISGCIFDADEFNNLERYINFVTEAYDTNSIIYRMFDIEKRPYISETMPDYINDYQKEERIKFFEKICEINKERSEEEKIVYFNTFISSIIDEAFVETIKKQNVKLDNSIHNDFEVSLKERSENLGINPHRGIINRSKKLMNALINENLALYNNNLIYSAEIDEMDKNVLFKLLESKSKSFDLESFFKKEDTTRASGIITEEVTLLFENFVADDTNVKFADHIMNANAIYKALYDEKIEGYNWMEEITRDGNILYQFVSTNYSFIWIPESITSYQLQELNKFNETIKSIYEKDRNYFNENPMEFMIKIGDNDEKVFINNIDEIIENLSNRMGA